MRFLLDFFVTSMLVILMFFRGNGFDADLYCDLCIILRGTMNDKGALLYGQDVI